MTVPAETIAAVAAAPGAGGVGIVRVAGPAAAAITTAVLGNCPVPRRAVFRHFRDAAGVIDSGIALFFAGPASYTGDDVLELHGHGGPVVLDLLLRRVLELGARAARPGEFTERAFLNGKLDLAQAEAVADLIEAGTAQAARAAQRSLDGEFSRRVHGLVEQLIGLRSYIEASIDFVDEEIDFLSEGHIAERIKALHEALAAVQYAARQGVLLHDGMTVVLAGRPNAGKSSLLNRLAGSERAIVTEVPGTTRDILRERLQLDGMPLHLIDTAGLREAADVVEREGIRRAWGEIEKADRILLMIDDAVGVTAEDRAIAAALPAGPGLTVLRNKIDLSGASPGHGEGELGDELRISATRAIGIDELREHLKACMGYRVAGEGGFSARRRHLDALARATASVDAARRRLAPPAAELIAEELRQAQQALGEITGEFTSEDLLGRIFSSFCIGK